MKTLRISRKRVQNLLDIISNESEKLELVAHQHLNRKNYWYSYSIILKEPKYTDFTVEDGELKVVTRDYPTGWKYKETLLENTSLKEAYNFAYELFEKNR